MSWKTIKMLLFPILAVRKLPPKEQFQLPPSHEILTGNFGANVIDDNILST